jgi:hypothetical protein
MNGNTTLGCESTQECERRARSGGKHWLSELCQNLVSTATTRIMWIASAPSALSRDVVLVHDPRRR